MNKTEIKETILACIAFTLLIAAFYGILLVGSALEEHQRCLNGATEYCIEGE